MPRDYIVLFAFCAAFLAPRSLCKLLPARSFCSAHRFCEEGGGVRDDEPAKEGDFKTKKDEMVDEGEDEMVEEIEDDLVDELVKKQYEDFPCPEVTAQQLEEEKLG